jgi:DNA-binding NarL/FixJ family response regulator
VAEALAKLLNSTGRFQVVGTAATIKAALALIVAGRPDVVVADLSLDDGNAIDLLRAFRRSGQRIRTLILTGFRHEFSVSEAMAAGAAGYVLKHDATVTLLDAIETVAAGGTYISAAVAPPVRYGKSGAEGDDLLGRLTAREKEIFALVVGGGVGKTIARHLGVTIKTVDTHRTNISRKLGARTTEDLLRFAAAHGIDITRTLPAFRGDAAAPVRHSRRERGKR